MTKKRIYSYAVQERINSQLPERVKNAMNICGWNALGIYEIVDSELKREKREARKEKMN